MNKAPAGNRVIPKFLSNSVEKAVENWRIVWKDGGELARLVVGLKERLCPNNGEGSRYGYTIHCF